MPPRIRLQTRQLKVRIYHHQIPSQPCFYASLATATTPAPPIEQTIHSVSPIARFPPTQPPSHKPPEVRKSQLHREYQSLLKSSPLILIFQHNNLRAVEWMGIRRELAIALRKVDAELAAAGQKDLYADAIKIQIIQTGIFASALRVVEFYNPETTELPTQHPSNPATASSAQIPNVKPTPEDSRLAHGLSRRAHEAASDRKKKLDLAPLLSGPIAVVAFPAVSPQHLKAALSILSPSAPNFPAPKRKASPSYHEPAVQNGIQKLMMLGARVDGKAFDQEGTKGVGSIPGGLDGLRAQLVGMLQNMGAGVTNALEGVSRSLYFTMEGRRYMMEEEEKGPEEKKDVEETKAE
ncbi:uncharacterized protein BDZ99DRAFT_252067 [Mytilinidion resinicola]|uniref:Ribosomal protein YmL11, mitochondrial n=1 Tax=Mytilinidion resinicola TaxID=574789 RepID=A0A6A6YXG0_9PEZI|nr:uncharacterized protein BDZ99DRAFT_252067 [Mytilinidion resinicola]KAF2813248.1 hypothetical protein BDZ99DRAFT_252067 [Mytilinidion resinicola]